jgi:unsaturated rhamnogalacturonyl hydrolase
MSKKIVLLLFYFLIINSAFAGKKYSSAICEESIKEVVNDAIAWQVRNMPTKGRAIWNPQFTGWADGVFLSAVADWAHYDNSRDFKSWYEKIAEDNRWEVGSRSLNPANDIAVALMYGRIWLDDPKPYYIVEKVDKWDYEMVMNLFGGWTPLIPTIERLDYQMKYYPKTDNLLFEVPQNQERWCWCDALYMAAPTYALFANITGNDEYREFMNREFWETYKALYDKDEKLFYRDTRFIDQREANGAKVFWGRGNGWVIGALARVLDFLPENYHSRDRYVGLFQEMMTRISSLQDENGYWHTSLLDYETFTSPETSASGFFTFGLWWGINRGLLDKETYLPIAVKAWEAMVNAVHEDGMLGYVQPIGDTPQNITAEKNEVYGTASFALAGLEVLKYCLSDKQ